MARQINKQILLDAKAVDGWSDPISVRESRHVQLSVAAAAGSTLTVKIAGSLLDKDDVDYTATAAVDNEWSYIDSWEYETTTTSVNKGLTGIAYSASAEVHIIEVNVDGLENIAVEVSGHSAGSATVKMMAVTNE